MPTDDIAKMCRQMRAVNIQSDHPDARNHTTTGAPSFPYGPINNAGSSRSRPKPMSEVHPAIPRLLEQPDDYHDNNDDEAALLLHRIRRRKGNHRWGRALLHVPVALVRMRMLNLNYCDEGRVNGCRGNVGLAAITTDTTDETKVGEVARTGNTTGDLDLELNGKTEEAIEGVESDTSDVLNVRGPSDFHVMSGGDDIIVSIHHPLFL
ncbi:Rho GTPase-activating protein 2 [Senna tora]|uniref:Rho GTPase-activating protein 2 n=1 Tax=Senna tora TaxID=362788 RepID=A0A835CGT1_9FABA|nr:Rho GTPase-activating protein 2 [Senna tora]